MKFSYNMIPTAVWHFQPPAGQSNTAAFYWMPAARHTDKTPHICSFLSAIGVAFICIDFASTDNLHIH